MPLCTALLDVDWGSEDKSWLGRFLGGHRVWAYWTKFNLTDRGGRTQTYHVSVLSNLGPAFCEVSTCQLPSTPD